MTDRKQTAESAVAQRWLVALPTLVVTLIVILVAYRETALAMVDTWSRSETYAHGFLVPPISLWLIWRLRRRLSSLPPRPGFAMLFLLGLAGLAWLLGELATVGVVSQFALTSMLVLSVPAVLGWSVARKIAFPLAFLFFAVPFGEFALPTMMEWTASFTVFALRLTGIPVYREGLQFVIPSGNWSVVEACSGVRYLIASFVVGTLFAYLTYRSLSRRLIFAAVSLVVPLIANWLRAYMIVMLGHLSGNTLAVGVDHLIYGWLFFGLVIMAMFWAGARWREDESHRETPDPEMSGVMPASVVRAGGRLSTLIAAASVIVVASIWPIAEWRIDRSVAQPLTRIEPLEPIPGWPTAEKPFVDWSPRFENPSAVLQTPFGEDGRTVGLYLAYYRNQEYSRKMVSSSNVMVTSSDRQWARVAGGSRSVPLDGRMLAVRSAELRSSADDRRVIVWQWYWINGHLTSSDYVAKVYTALSRLTGQGDDSAVIFAYAPKEEGDGMLEAFVKAAEPRIESALNRSREKR